MAFSPENRDLHDRMLRAWVEALLENEYMVVTAALPEFVDKPRPVMGGPVPDVVAKDKDDFVVLGQVKTADDIENEHTRWQLQNYQRIGSRVLLLVPKKSLNDAVSAIESWDCGPIEVWSHVDNGK